MGGPETPGTPSCCQGGVRPCQWIRLGSSIRFSTRTRNRVPTSVLMPKAPPGCWMPYTDAGLPFTSMPRRCSRSTVCGSLPPCGLEDSAWERARVGASAEAAAADSNKARRESMVRPPEQSHGAIQGRRGCEVILRAAGREGRGRPSVHMRCNSRAITIPAASARNDSSAITGTGGHGFSPPSMRIAGAACGVISMPA